LIGVGGVRDAKFGGQLLEAYPQSDAGGVVGGDVVVERQHLLLALDVRGAIPWRG